jgi:succinate dehydrogenase hydrophobic anchor subunit
MINYQLVYHPYIKISKLINLFKKKYLEKFTNDNDCKFSEQGDDVNGKTRPDWLIGLVMVGAFVMFSGIIFLVMNFELAKTIDEVNKKLKDQYSKSDSGIFNNEVVENQSKYNIFSNLNKIYYLSGVVLILCILSYIYYALVLGNKKDRYTYYKNEYNCTRSPIDVIGNSRDLNLPNIQESIRKAEADLKNAEDELENARNNTKNIKLNIVTGVFAGICGICILVFKLENKYSIISNKMK